MPLIMNPVGFLASSGNCVWRCKNCRKVFLFIDDGEEHEKNCHLTSAQPDGVETSEKLDDESKDAPTLP